MNIFDILGPVMVGPSSSHTAGAVRIGLMTRKLLGQPVKKAAIGMHGSFLATGTGHGTDCALIAGMLGMAPDDTRIPDSFRYAKKAGLTFSFEAVNLRDAHPNSVLIHAASADGHEMELQACSLGGGRIMINSLNGVEVNCTCELPTLIVNNVDEPGYVAAVTSMLSGTDINIANLSLYRDKRGGSAVMVVEVDEEIPPEAIEWLEHQDGIRKVIYIGQEMTSV